MPDSYDLYDLLELLRLLNELGREPVPDIGQLRQIRILWQIILGIDEHGFDASKYTNISLELRSRLGNVTYQCLASQEPDPSFSIHNALGDVLLTRSMIRSIEEETGHGRREDITQELSMINKIRLVLFDLENVISNVSVKTSLVEYIARAYEYEIQYHMNAGVLLEDTTSDLIKNEDSLVPLMFESNNVSFDTCYKQSLLMLTASSRSGTDTRSKIHKAAKLTVESFMNLNNISIVYNLHLISEYHLRIFNIIKYPLRNLHHKHNLEHAIDEYFSLHPILPILKPIIRQLTSESRPLNDSTSEIFGLLAQLVEKYLQTSSAPLPVKWFPRVFEVYVNVLQEEGTNFEQDVFFQDIKRATLKWKDREITSNSFAKELLALSLIPSSEPFSFDGQILPSPAMRYALVSVKNEFDLKSKYMRLWFDSMTYLHTDRELLSIWKRSVKQTYLKKWFDRTIDNVSKNEEAAAFQTLRTLRDSFHGWKVKTEAQRELQTKADTQLLSKTFSRWKQKVAVYSQQENKCLDLGPLKKKYFKLWRLASMDRGSHLARINNQIIIKVTFDKWRSKFSQQQKLVTTANETRKLLTQSHFFDIWVSRSSSSLKKVQTLQHYERQLLQAKTFQSWVKAYNLHMLKQEVQHNNDQHLVHWIFQNWKQFHTHERILGNYLREQDAETLKKYFAKWLSVRRLNAVADQFRDQSVIQRTVEQWKLSLQESKVRHQREKLIAEKYLKSWRLRTRRDAFLQGVHDRSTSRIFDLWHEAASRYSSLRNVADDAATKSRKKTFFRSWDVLVAQRQQALVRAEEWRMDQDEKRDRELLETLVQLWKHSATENELKRQKLETILAKFNSSSTIAKKFRLWREKYTDFRQDEDEADDFRALTLETRMLGKWIRRFDRVLELNQICDNQIEVNNVDLLSHIVSQMSLKAIKIQTDLRNADRFKERWTRNKQRMFFDMWRYGYEAKKNQTQNQDVFAEEPIPTLSPLAQRLRGTNSMLDSSFSVATPGRLLRTPAVARTSTIPATERVRRMYMEQRRSQYRQVKQTSPEKSLLLTPTRRNRVGRVSLEEDNVFIQRDET
ncbi:hypothetical protein OGAPHI_003980 [Ogataea philodendri]|uniref:Sfi1 spindle body domain-containing protein n=1 Tax=Ogataea philodendri TaxID=1378263 RepID=A0A9P8P5U4_9ASCO|nr:uncharacterized protein OGAPHI_003980 [Ogataea philodendri]KAH3665792.1 hypothetical protein OGAPHI_003980 [Ogataea philodendri]